MNSNNIVNFQGSTTILNACKKKSGNLLKALRNYSIAHYYTKYFKILSFLKELYTIKTDIMKYIGY